MMMEAVSTFKTQVTFYESARPNIPEDCHLPFTPYSSWKLQLLRRSTLARLDSSDMFDGFLKPVFISMILWDQLLSSYSSRMPYLGISQTEAR